MLLVSPNPHSAIYGHSIWEPSDQDMPFDLSDLWVWRSERRGKDSLEGRRHSLIYFDEYSALSYVFERNVIHLLCNFLLLSIINFLSLWGYCISSPHGYVHRFPKERNGISGEAAKREWLLISLDHEQNLCILSSKWFECRSHRPKDVVDVGALQV